MNTEKLTPQIQNHITQMQQNQQQLQALSMQKNSVIQEITQSQMALKEIEKLTNEDAEIYKIIGEFMIKSNRNSVVIELGDKIENLKIREQTIIRQEERLANKFKQLQEQLKEMVEVNEKE